MIATNRRDESRSPRLAFARALAVVPAFALAAGLVASLAACAGQERANRAGGADDATAGEAGEPSWVARAAGVYESERGKKVLATGSTPPNPNSNLMMQMARDKGRQAIGRTVATMVQALAADYQEKAREHLDAESTDSTELRESVGRGVSNQTVSGAQQVEAWRNPATGEMVTLMELDFGFFANAYKQQMEQQVKRRLFEKNMQEQVRDALKRLDEQIEAMHAMGSADFNARYGAAPAAQP